MIRKLARLTICAIALVVAQRGYAQAAGQPVAEQDPKAKAMELRREMQELRKEIVPEERKLLKGNTTVRQQVQEIDKQINELQASRAAIFGAENAELAAKYARLNQIKEDMKQLYARGGKAKRERKAKGEKRQKGKGKGKGKGKKAE